MKILAVLTQPPTAEGSAPSRCALGLMRGLLAHGIEVRAVAARRHFAVDGPVPDDLDVEIVDLPEEPSYIRAQLRRARRPRGELARPQFLGRVRAAAKDCDCVHFDEIDTAWCNQGIDNPSALHLHFRALSDRLLGSIWRRQFRTVSESAIAELIALRRHDHLIASSPDVAESLRRSSRTGDVTLSPLTLDPSVYSVPPPPSSPVAGVIGTAAWPPTRGAMTRLIGEVWPLVRKECPGASLQIAGRGTLEVFGREPGPGVEVVGEVDSAAEFLGRLSVMLNPIERGSGMKVKTLEALAMGLPVVTTVRGAEGIVPNPGVIVASSNAELSQAAIGLLDDEDDRRLRGQAARRTFDETYSPVPAVAPLVELYRRISR